MVLKELISGLPCILSREGIREILSLPLTQIEQEQLTASFHSLKELFPIFVYRNKNSNYGEQLKLNLSHLYDKITERVNKSHHPSSSLIGNFLTELSRWRLGNPYFPFTIIKPLFSQGLIS